MGLSLNWVAAICPLISIPWWIEEEFLIFSFFSFFVVTVNTEWWLIISLHKSSIFPKCVLQSMNVKEFSRMLVVLNNRRVSCSSSCEKYWFLYSRPFQCLYLSYFLLLFYDSCPNSSPHTVCCPCPRVIHTCFVVGAFIILIFIWLDYIVSWTDVTMKFFWGRVFHKSIFLRPREMLPYRLSKHISRHRNIIHPQIFIKYLICARQYSSSGGWIWNDWDMVPFRTESLVWKVRKKCTEITNSKDFKKKKKKKGSPTFLAIYKK